jgi:hypothetical protein
LASFAFLAYCFCHRWRGSASAIFLSNPGIPSILLAVVERAFEVQSCELENVKLLKMR